MKLSPTASVPHLALPSPSMSSAPRRAAAPAGKPGPARGAAKEVAAKKGGADDQAAAKAEAERGAKVAPKKKRVRLKPETPEQLIERLRNPQLSLHEASILLRVSRATVRRYADSGRLVCQRTPGGQRRFYLRDIENFYRQLKLKR